MDPWITNFVPRQPFSCQVRLCLIAVEPTYNQPFFVYGPWTNYYWHWDLNSPYLAPAQTAMLPCNLHHTMERECQVQELKRKLLHWHRETVEFGTNGHKECRKHFNCQNKNKDILQIISSLTYRFLIVSQIIWNRKIRIKIFSH